MVGLRAHQGGKGGSNTGRREGWVETTAGQKGRCQLSGPWEGKGQYAPVDEDGYRRDELGRGGALETGFGKLLEAARYVTPTSLALFDGHLG